MKNRVELYILSGIILLLSMYIIFREDRNINYTIPTLNTMAIEDITNITFDSIKLSQKNGEWYLSSGYPAAKASIKRVTTELVNLRIIDKISDSDNDRRFGLDAPKNLKVYNGEKVLIDLYIGSTSPTGNYTYIKLPNKTGVFSIRGDISNLFGKTEEDLRSKEILSLENPLEVTITKGEDVITKSEGDLSELDFLKNLKADSFKELARDEVLLTLSIKSDKESKSLIVYQNVDGQYPATSSQVDYPFTLPEYIVKKIEAIE